MFGISVLNFFFGLLIDKNERHIYRKLILLVGISFNVAVLVLYKYLAYLKLSYENTGLLSLFEMSSEFIYPVGLSFYVYESISYLIEGYKKEIYFRKKFTEFFYFISYFPHLLSGPIIKPTNFFNEFDLGFHFSISNLKVGSFRFFIGLIKKVILADTIAYFWLDDVFKNPGQFHQLDILIACFGALSQIYFDLSGYTDMAIGISRCFGISLPENFKSPFIAESISDFWRTWHMSLSNWFRENVFKPLIFKKNNECSRGFAVLVTMALIGIWHGFNSQQIFWGLLQGALILFSRYMRRYNFLNDFKFRKILFCTLTVSSIAVTVGLYKSSSASATIQFYKAFFGINNYDVVSVATPWWGVLVTGICFLTQFLSKQGYKSKMESAFLTKHFAFTILLIVLIVSLIYFTDDRVTKFAYFKI